jgi:hypothetical protein
VTIGVALLLLAFATTALATLGSSAAFPPLPRLTLSGGDALPGTLPAVRADVVEQLLGRANVARLLPGADTAHELARSFDVSVPASRADVAASAARAPAPNSADNGSDQASKGTLASTLAPGDWTLRPSMSADRATAARGEEIIFAVRIANVGSAPYTGDLTVGAHVPFGTTAQQPARCGQPVMPGADRQCQAVQVPVSGSPDSAGLYEVNSQAVNVTIAPGGVWTYTFRVVVDSTNPSGTMLRSYGRAQVGGGGWQDTGAVEVKVS